MLKTDHIDPTKWFTVRETADLLGWEVDFIYDRINDGQLEAQWGCRQARRGKRKYVCYMVQGCEIIRYAKEHMTRAA